MAAVPPHCLCGALGEAATAARLAARSAPVPSHHALSSGRSGQQWGKLSPSSELKGVSSPRKPEACSVGGGMKGRGCGSPQELETQVPLAGGLGWPGWWWGEHTERHPLTFHVGGNRQKQIFHGFIKSFKLTKFL